MKCFARKAKAVAVRPRHVCMVAYAFYESDNRIRRYAESLVLRGDEVEVVSLRQKGQDVRSSLRGVSIFRIQERTIDEKSKFDYLARLVAFLFKSFWFLTIREIRRPYDLIHVHSVPDFEVFAAVVPKLFGARVILDIHDIVPEFYASKFHAGAESVLSRFLKVVEKVCCAFSDHVIISNHLWGERIVLRSVPKKKCSVIMNNPDPLIFSKQAQSRGDGKLRLLYPGTLAWHQGIDIAIKGVSIIKRRVPYVELHLYGKGPVQDDLKVLSNELGLQHYVFFNGMIPLEEVVDQMACSDIGIIPKRADDFGDEAFSTKTLEFMMLGVPIVVAETKIDRYYFNDDIACFFRAGDENDFAEKIIALAENPARRKLLAENATRFIAKNNWNEKKQVYFQLVDTLTGRSAPEDSVPVVQPEKVESRTKAREFEPVSAK